MRRLELEFSDQVSFRLVMCGLAREFGEREPLIAESLEVAAATGMPVDVRLWLAPGGAPSSSYPACIAVKAAAEQGLERRYLRVLREGLLCRARKLDAAEAFVTEARSVPGLDLERFRIDLASHAILEAFGADLDRAAAVPEAGRDPATGRVRLPSVEFVGEDGVVHGVYGPASYESLRAAAIAAGAAPALAAPSLTPLEALSRFGTMATMEVAAVCDLPGPRAPAELWRLASEWRVHAERVGSGGVLWSLA